MPSPGRGATGIPAPGGPSARPSAARGVGLRWGLVRKVEIGGLS